jgi:fructokinase
LRELEQAGVNTTAVAQDPELKTGLCFLQIDEDGERSFFSYRTQTAEIHFGPADLDEVMLSQAKAVHLCPTPMKLPSGREAILRAAAVARDHGAMVSADCNLRPKHWGSAEEATAAGWDLARVCDVLKLNEEEAVLVAGDIPPLDAAQRLLESGPKLVVITLGSQGAIWATQSEHGHVPAPRVHAVDATGCGDAWVAGLLARLITTEQYTDDSVTRAISEANRLGAAVATVYGATTPIQAWPD